MVNARSRFGIPLPENQLDGDAEVRDCRTLWHSCRWGAVEVDGEGEHRLGDGGQRQDADAARLDQAGGRLRAPRATSARPRRTSATRSSATSAGAPARPGRGRAPTCRCRRRRESVCRARRARRRCRGRQEGLLKSFIIAVFPFGADRTQPKPEPNIPAHRPADFRVRRRRSPYLGGNPGPVHGIERERPLLHCGSNDAAWSGVGPAGRGDGPRTTERYLANDDGVQGAGPGQPEDDARGERLSRASAGRTTTCSSPRSCRPRSRAAKASSASAAPSSSPPAATPAAAPRTSSSSASPRSRARSGGRTTRRWRRSTSRRCSPTCART